MSNGKHSVGASSLTLRVALKGVALSSPTLGKMRLREIEFRMVAHSGRTETASKIL